MIHPKLAEIKSTLAIAMWDFSWLERSWPGAGYEDWDRALDELCERGYNAVRIDAYPHLLASDANREWTILPCWNQNDWGSPALNRIRVQPCLTQFIEKCGDRGIRVGLSTWFQRDSTGVVEQIASASTHARIWIETLKAIQKAGCLEHILYVDLCNEWPFQVWAPFFNVDDQAKYGDSRSMTWMKEAIDLVRQEFAQIPLTFSIAGEAPFGISEDTSIDFMDFFEPHIWMVAANQNEFYRRINYNFERWDEKGYQNVVKHGEKLYRSDPEYWTRKLVQKITDAAEFSRKRKLPLITTECWGVIDYKDWPLLDWGWVKELCELGVTEAVKQNQWVAIGTSNFCGPQFVGMWRDIEWHRKWTSLIRNSHPTVG